MKVRRIQLLLRPAWRTPEGIERVLRLAKELGLEATGSGVATISVRADRDVFERVFGSSHADPLRVPEAIGDFVESAAIAPEHEYFDDRPAPPDRRDAE